MTPFHLRVVARVPSKSNQYRIGRGRLYTTPDVVAYETSVMMAAIQARQALGLDVVFPKPAFIQVVMHWSRWIHDVRSRDLDGCFKATFDALTRARVWDDDAQVTAIHATQSFDQAEEGDECLSLTLSTLTQTPPTSRPRSRRSRSVRSKL